MKIIAEIGLNHCGSVDRAQNLVEDLCLTSVDAISFQIREKSFYDQSHPRKMELPVAFYRDATSLVHQAKKSMCIAIAEKTKISEFDEVGIDFWKTLSWDLNNVDLLNALQKTNKQLYVSTGMSSMEEIERVSNIWGGVEFIHTQLNDVIDNSNLKAISRIRNITGNAVAFGLHCVEHEVIYAVIGFEPSALFFYVKDTTDGEHPDDLHAITINEVDHTIQTIRLLEKSLGDGEKNKMENTMHPEDDNVCKGDN